MTAPAPNREQWRCITLQRSGADMGEGIGFNPEAGVDPLVIPEHLYQVHRIGQTVDDPREWCNGLVIISVDVPGLDTIPDDVHGDDLNAAFQKHTDMIITEAKTLLRAALKELETILEAEE